MIHWGGRSKTEKASVFSYSHCHKLSLPCVKGTGGKCVRSAHLREAQNDPQVGRETSAGTVVPCTMIERPSARRADGGIVMRSKHNRQLVPFAKQLRKEMTKEERHLWYDFLREYPIRFTRQKVLGKYIADFYCARAGLVVELDGSQHYEEEALAKDAERTAFLEVYKLRVLRIQNNEVNRNFEGVCLYIDGAVRQSLSQPDG